MHLKTRLKSFLLTPRFIAGVALSVLIFLSAGGSLSAQIVLQGYNSDETLQRGMLVKLKKDDATKVEAVTNDTLADLKGVVADSKDAPVTLSGDSGKVFVATSGKYEVLVSNENGTIKPGDYISGSTLAGIGMKANDINPVVLGQAIDSFSGNGDSIGKTAAEGGKSVAFGRIKVDLAVGKNPLKKTGTSDNIPKVLQSAAQSVAEKPVSPGRIYLAAGLLALTGVVSSVALFSGIRSTIISIGRNPLSKQVILKGLVQVLLVSLIIFLTGIFGVYLLIKL